MIIIYEYTLKIICAFSIFSEENHDLKNLK